VKQPPRLTAVFLQHAKVPLTPPEDLNVLERLLGSAFESARAPWPGLNLPDETFIRHVSERLPESGAAAAGAIESLLAQLSLPELYLACACLHGTPDAVETFERNYLVKLPGVLAYLKQSSALIEDICQMTRVRVLIGTAEGGARISDYTGRGPLLSWMRVIASRVALKLMAAERPPPDEHEPLLEALPAPEHDAELELIKRRYDGEFRQAVRDAFSAISREDRHLLRLYFVDRVSTPELGTLFRVNQSTISRWLKRARQAVYDETRRLLQERLGLSSGEFASLLLVLDSQLDVSLSQLFGGGESQGL